MNNELLEELHSVKNHKYSTRKVYRFAVNKYTKFCNMSLEELLEEAEREEEEGVRWKKRKLKRRLLSYRQYLIENFAYHTVRSNFTPILSIYRYYEIEILDLPRINKKGVKMNAPITYADLPDKEIIRNALKIASPRMRAIICFTVSSGCAARETLNLTIRDYIEAVSEYTNKSNIFEVIDDLNTFDDVVPTFKILRDKTQKHYITYCSPEAVDAINHYLLNRSDPLKMESPLFKIDQNFMHLKFRELNNELGLGKVGEYVRLRSHMLRKFHASALYNDGMSLDKVNDLQGKAKNKTDQVYFMTNPEDLKFEYIEHLHAITMHQDVERLSIKSPEFIHMEKENNQLKLKLDKFTEDMEVIKKNFADISK